LAGRPVAQFPCAPRFLGFAFGFLFQAAHFLDGLEDQDLIDSGIACLAQPLLGGLNLPAAHGRPCAVAVRDRNVGVVGGIPEVDFTHGSRA